MNSLKSTNLLMLGEKGNGKSSTGNSILGINAFKSKAKNISERKGFKMGVSQCNGRQISMISVPGVEDTKLDNIETVKLVMQVIQSAVAASPEGFHACLLVFRYGQRFRQEDKDALSFLKDVFGKEFVREYCILVMTYGDCFERDIAKTGQSFPDWCQEQTGILKDILIECDNRTVLFDNATRDEGKKKVQVTKLLEIVDNLGSRGQRYTDENFEMAQRTRDRILIEVQIPMIEQEISLLSQKCDEIQINQDPEIRTEALNKLFVPLSECLRDITDKDHGTGVLNDQLFRVQAIKRSVEEEIKFCDKQKAEKKMKEDEKKIFKEKMKAHKREAKMQEPPSALNKSTRLGRAADEDREKNKIKELETRLRQMEEDVGNLKKQFKEMEEDSANMRKHIKETENFYFNFVKPKCESIERTLLHAEMKGYHGRECIIS